MTIFIHAPNVHQGGGRRLILCLLHALDRPVIAHLDARLRDVPPLPEKSQVRRVAPSVWGRLRAEGWLYANPGPQDHILCFGNLPPLLQSRAQVSVLLQNVYLVADANMSGLPRSTRARLQIERLWLRAALRGAQIIVQTHSMAQHVQAHLNRTAQIFPFWSPLPVISRTDPPLYDFLYVASGEAHKNHLNLFEAWEMLAHDGVTPSLCVTLPPDQGPHLHARIAQAVASGAHIITRIGDSTDDMAQLYADAHQAIYPSFFESFGLPLLEARAAGLSVIASDLPYVRDVLTPEDSFDPTSPEAIAQAVRRALTQQMPDPIKDPVPLPMSPRQFITQVFGKKDP